MMGMKLYRLLPFIIRYQDKLSTGSPMAQILEKVVQCIEEESDTTYTEIVGLFNQIQPDEADKNYLLFLSLMLGFAISDAGDYEDEKFKRWFVKNLVLFYKIIGTHLSWKKLWIFSRGEKQLNAEELWKEEIHEDTEWYRGDEYYLLIHAARFDLYRNIDGVKQFLSVEDADPLAQDIDIFRPIHVLLRRFVQEVVTEDELNLLQDSRDLNALYSLTEYMQYPSDKLVVTTNCNAVCEMSLEVDPCSTFCEIACEVALEYMGPTGPQGEQGEQGVQGEQGDTGLQGDPGDDGCDGCETGDDVYLWDYSGAQPNLTIWVAVEELSCWEVGEDVYFMMNSDICHYTANGIVTAIEEHSVGLAVVWCVRIDVISNVPCETGTDALGTLCHGRYLGSDRTLCKCTAVDTPSAGLHTFKECDREGNILTGDDERIFTSCWCVGDFDDDWELSIESGKETSGIVFTKNGQNMVFITGLFGFYSE